MRAPPRATLPVAGRGSLAAGRVEAALLAIAAVFFALHFVHLTADFPNRSPWMDWAKYTDEGWYGDAAIRHYQLGHWNAPGDFNPAAALPVWPMVEMGLFRLTGVSLKAARALSVSVFGMTLMCGYLLLRRWSTHRTVDLSADAPPGWPRTRPLAPAISVLLLSISPFCFAFMRLAILEPLLIQLTLVALLVASAAGRAAGLAWSEGTWAESLRSRASLRAAGWASALGLLLSLIVLTKTTGLFLFPAILWLLWAAVGGRLRPMLGAGLLATATGAAVWAAYFGLFVRPRYLLDFRYLFSANAYTGITRDTFWPVLHDALFDGAWIGATLFVLALAAAVVSLARLCLPRLRSNPLAVALALWVLGYGGFVTYHANLQPRYYLVLAVPLTMLAAIGFDPLLAAALAGSGARKPARSQAVALKMVAALFGAAMLFAIVNGARQTIAFVLHPEYTFVTAAAQIREAIDREAAAHPDQSRLVLSISGADLSLITGLPSICDDFGTMTLPERVAAYRPGWFAAWNDVEDDKMESLAPLYRVVRVGEWPAFDDPDRNLLILYRLDPVASPGPPGRPGRRRLLSVPRRLRTRVGEQPSLLQLKH
jgi:hypothetical protein